MSIVNPGTRNIEAVPTSVTGFIGAALHGPIDEPVLVTNFVIYERMFGGLRLESPMSYAVQQYFLNGGQDAVIVRVQKKKRCLKDLKNLISHSKPDQSVGYHEIANPGLETDQRGLWAFDKGDPINLLCVPSFALHVDVDQATWLEALKYC